MSLSDYIKDEIRHNGPMSLATYMMLANAHYYNHSNPFGAEGDFITAPDISQMFGELIGAWAADCWIKMGEPKKFLLVECGPGRGTLMADALRATNRVDGFHEAAQIMLVENSHSLIEQQKSLLSEYEISWCGELSSLSKELPIILIANEFLDALPIKQYRYNEGAWSEVMIGLDDNGELENGLQRVVDDTLPKDAKEGDVFELSEMQNEFVKELALRLNEQKGTALLIDYGYIDGRGDTLQAVKDHKPVSCLEKPGEVDLTSHVNFSALKRAAGACKVHGPVSQSDFLKSLGIEIRAQMLLQGASENQKLDIEQGLKRLIDPEQMGTLFKVLSLSSASITPSGF